MSVAHLPPPRPASSIPDSSSRLAIWEELFRNVSPAQQQDLLALARRQGLLYGSQLPRLANGNGSRPVPHVEEPACRQILSRILGGHAGELEPVARRPVDVADDALDAIQREAVAQALNTPDICLIQGLPGSGKSRVVAEIVVQATARGMRVLLLAPTGAALDRVLMLIAGTESVCPARCVGTEESLEALAPAIRVLTVPEQARFLREQSQTRARAALADNANRYRQWQGQETVWPRLDDLVSRARRCEGEIETIDRQCSECAGAVELDAGESEAAAATADGRPASVFAQAIRDLAAGRTEARARFDARTAEIGRRVTECRSELNALEPEMTALRPLAAAKQRGRWWTWRWWRATLRGNVISRLAELDRLHDAARQAASALEEQARQLDQDRAEAESCHRQERERLVAAEVDRRRAEIEQSQQAVRDELEGIQEQWRRECGQLDPAHRPAAMTPQALQSAVGVWKSQLAQEEQQLRFAQDWVAYLQESADTLSRRLPGYINLVAATTSGLAADEHFGERSPLGRGFDLLILEEADQVTESEFQRVARLARRWVLVGSTVPRKDKDPQPTKNGDSFSARPILPAAFFQQLWYHLHFDPRRLPYTWVQEKDRLCCRLRPLGSDQAHLLESERVADFPDIELRILVLPRLQPLLVDVVFPSTMSIVQAKEYIFKELQELPVQASGPGLRWRDEADVVVLEMGVADDGQENAVHLEAGVREILGRTGLPRTDGNSPLLGWHTVRLEFDRRCGWSWERAQEWVRRYLGVRDLGRTTRLTVPYRMKPGLAAFLSEHLFEEAYSFSPRCGPHGPPEPHRPSEQLFTGLVELVAVPSATEEAAGRPGGQLTSRKHDNGRRLAATARRPAPTKGGAGLELDLASPSHLGRLPSELRGELPSRGLINYLEARAVVRALEALATDPAARQRVWTLQDETARLRRLGSLPHPLLSNPTVAVLALYPAQVQLIRCLLRRSPALAGTDLAVEVDLPAAFRHREADLVMVSLTRSHAHRAVSFGDDPGALGLALTRARSSLLLFGDPGTLARRSQWQGPVDHLGAVDAERERKLVAGILGCQPVPGPSPCPSRQHEGSGA
jgi:hypothetical protein